MGKILTQLPAAGLSAPSLQSGSSLFPVQPSHIWQSPCCPPCRVLVLPCAQTSWSGLWVKFNPSPVIWPLRVGRKVDCLPVLFLQVQVIKMAFPTLKAESFFQVHGWSGRHQGALTKSCWRFHDNLSGELLGLTSSNMQAAPCS